MADNNTKSSLYLIDVTPVYAGDKETLEFSYTLDCKDITSDSDICFTSDVVASGTLKQTASASSSGEGYVELEVCVCTDILSQCARCLEDVRQHFEVKAVYGVTPFLQNAEENETCLMTDNGFLDMEEIARTLLVLNLPSKYLCKSDCKGLCSSCGANLNNEDCKCTGKEVDPRLSALKQFFKG